MRAPTATVGLDVSVQGVGVTLGRTPILVDAGFDAAPGVWVGMIGPYGAGKSTLLRAIVGLVDHTGSVRIGGQTLDRVERARTIAFVPQSPVLPPGMTVGEYVLLGRTAHLSWLGRESSADRDAAIEALERLELGRFVDRDVTALSGGEVQRVSLARAIASACPVLLLDEPTRGVDIGAKAEIYELIDELAREGLAVLFASSEMEEILGLCDRCLVLRGGEVMGELSRSELSEEAVMQLATREDCAAATGSDRGGSA